MCGPTDAVVLLNSTFRNYVAICIVKCISKRHQECILITDTSMMSFDHA